MRYICYGVWCRWGPVTSSKVAAILATILDFTKIVNLTGKEKIEKCFAEH